MDASSQNEPLPPASSSSPGSESPTGDATQAFGSSLDDAPTRPYAARPPLVAAPPPMATTRDFQHYEVCLREDGTLHELGRGAMGISYKARDVNLDVPVAIKVIGAGLPTDTHARERFQREARAAAQLRHPNVASVFHFGRTPAGESFYAMEFIEGETLLARVGREGPLPAAQVIEIALQVTAALIAADECGLVHRDLKPANLMQVASTTRSRVTPRAGPVGSAGAATTPRLTIKVIDFGLAKAADDAVVASYFDASLTQEGIFLGTPAYASPEQAEGGKIDARSDIYSLGVTLWFLLTGKTPFSGRTFSEIYDRQMHRKLPVAHLAEVRVGPAFARVLARMIAPDPDDRPASPAELYDALERCRAETGGASFLPAIPLTYATRRRVGSKTVFLSGMFILLLAVVGTAAFLKWRHADDVRAPAVPDAPAAPAAGEKSIAVLPFMDLSADHSYGYFADGIQDDVINSLAKIKALKVIGRSSVMVYRDIASRNLPDISQRLGVATILEGSVRRAPDRVLVNVALIDAHTGLQIWAEHYDRTMQDALTLQGELATEIATALQTTLSPEERARVTDQPTTNAKAYALYLHARELQLRPTGLLQDYQGAERLYRQALALDPRFAVAHARLAACLAYSYLNFQPTPEVHDEARREAEESLRLQPDLGEGSLARALCLYWTEKDYPAALRELEVTARLLPGSAEVDFFTGAIRRRQGLWRDASASMRRAQVRDPRSVLMAREILLTDCMLRDWTAAARDGGHAVALAPDLPMLRVESCYVDFWARQDLAPLNAMLAAVPAGEDPDGEITLARWDAAMLARDFAAAERVVTTSAAASIETPFGAVLPRSYLLGCTALARGDVRAAQTQFEAAREPLETEARNVPLDAFRQAQLGLLYAFLGRKDDAIRQGRRAVGLLPESKDAYFGPDVSGLLALIYARTGETGPAVSLLKRLVTTPGALAPVFEGSATLADLRGRWQWDPLRADPRFRALVDGAEPRTAH